MFSPHTIQPIDFHADSANRFARTLLSLTQRSGHSHEKAVHRLLCDLAENRRLGVISPGEYHAIIGKAADVADFFNYDLGLLQNETNRWYRASVIHQMGQGILQAIERLRPDLAAGSMFADAVHGLSLSMRGPVSCRQWASDIARAEGCPEAGRRRLSDAAKNPLKSAGVRL